MNLFKLKSLSSLLLVGGLSISYTANAAVANFSLAANATFGNANETPGAFNGGCPDANCYVRNGIVVGVVNDPNDSGAHFHKAGTSTDPEAQYHPDSTGLYVRMADLSNFSLQSIWIDTTHSGSTGGNFKLYGYANAINPGLLTNSGAALPPDPVTNPNGTLFSPSDPEGGTVTPIASYSIPNDAIFAQNITLANLLTADGDWGNIGAFWLTMEGFNHSPTTNYAYGSYPDWDVRIDDINLGAPVPVPGAVWLMSSGLLGMLGMKKRRMKD